MPTCDVCGEDLSPTSTLTCADCDGDFCRSHYHDHDCEPDVGEELEDAPTPADTQPKDVSTSPVATIGYAVGILLGLAGLRYFVENFELVLYGSQGADAFQALVSLGISGAFFSFATFVLVGSYIISQS